MSVFVSTFSLNCDWLVARNTGQPTVVRSSPPFLRFGRLRLDSDLMGGFSYFKCFDVSFNQSIEMLENMTNSMESPS
jgi:hypothetical protein